MVRPPHSSKDFIQQFTELIGNIATNYDRFLLVGDFNIHVCSLSNSLSGREFRVKMGNLSSSMAPLDLWSSTGLHFGSFSIFSIHATSGRYFNAI